MGLIRAAADALKGSLADQWKDFYTVPRGVSPSAAVVRAVSNGQDVSRGTNVVGSSAVITKGSKFVVPEGYALVLLEDGGFTGLVAEPGAYFWDSEALDSQSIFAGDGVVSPLLKSSWERFKFGGRPQSEQIAVFVSLQEISNNKFGSASDIYWDDRFLNTQVGARVRGVFSLQIIDPLTFLRNFVPNHYIQKGHDFDFSDLNNPAAQQLFDEVVGCLAAAFASYANALDKDSRLASIQKDAIGFGASLFESVDSVFQWKSKRGLQIVNTSIVSIDYDDASKELLKAAKRADALAGARGNSNLQASVAAGIEAAGNVEGATGILGVGLAVGSLGLGNLQQNSDSPPAKGSQVADVSIKLQEYKGLFEADLITKDEYEALKTKLLGL